MSDLGLLQWGECQRGGERVLARSLVKDGRLPNLLVCTGCYDPPHPGEQPFVPNPNEGRPKHHVAPELLPTTSPVLEGVAAGAAAWDADTWEDSPLAWLLGSWSEGGIELTWTRPLTIGPRIERYDIWRQHESEAEFSLIDQVEFEYSIWMEVLNEPESYPDASATATGNYSYYVEAVAGDNSRIRSNTLVVEVPS